MKWWMPWRRQARQDDAAIKAAEQLRDRAEEQRRRVQAITPRVDATVRSLRELRAENGFASMIENVTRGTTR